MGGGERADVSVRARAFIPDWLKKRKKEKKREKKIYDSDVLLCVGASGLPQPHPKQPQAVGFGHLPQTKLLGLFCWHLKGFASDRSARCNQLPGLLSSW